LTYQHLCKPCIGLEKNRTAVEVEQRRLHEWHKWSDCLPPSFVQIISAPCLWIFRKIHLFEKGMAFNRD